MTFITPKAKANANANAKKTPDIQIAYHTSSTDSLPRICGERGAECGCLPPYHGHESAVLASIAP